MVIHHLLRFQLNNFANQNTRFILSHLKARTSTHNCSKENLATKAGVFTFGHAVDFLKQNKVKDVCVIQHDLKKTDSKRFAGTAPYLVIGSGVSQRHLSVIAESLIKEYKSAMGPEFMQCNRPPKVEGTGVKSSWISCDFGDFLVHVMLPEVREKYQIESLHIFGPEYDTTRPTHL